MTDPARPSRPRFRTAALVGLLALTGALLTASPAAAADPPGCGPLDAAPAGALADCVTIDGVKAHLAALQGTADADGGTRVSGTPGYQASVDYATQQATAAAVPVDRQLPPTGGSTSGCEAADFAGFPAGSIALLQRGTCEFGVKAGHAAAAGAVGAVILNEGNPPDRHELLRGGLAAPAAIPVVGVPFALGQALSNATPSLRVDAVSELRTSTNVLASCPARTRPRCSWSARTWTRCRRGPGSTTTAAAAPRSWRWPASSPRPAAAARRRPPSASPGGEPRSWACWVPRPTWRGSRRPSGTASTPTSTSTWSARRTRSTSATTATTPTPPARAPDRPAPRRSRTCWRSSSPTAAGPRRAPTSTGARTTGRSSPPASRRAARSPAPRA